MSWPATAVASIGILKAEGLLEHLRTVAAEVIAPGLADIAERHPSVGEFRARLLPGPGAGA